MTVMEPGPKSKRIRLRQECSYCGVNVGKSSYYKHIVECMHRPKSGEGSDSDDTVASFTVGDLDQQKRPRSSLPLQWSPHLILVRITK